MSKEIRKAFQDGYMSGWNKCNRLHRVAQFS